jgi:hypothetical protein
LLTSTRPLSRSQFIIGALIAYGSLYPFDFVWPDATGKALAALFEASHLWSSRGDVAGNLLLFLPWGGLMPQVPPGRRWHWPTFIYGLALAVVLQLLQLGLPSRDAALSDVFWNGIGIVTGQLLLYPLIARLYARDATPTQLNAGIVLPLLWLTLMALPLVPSLDWQSLKAHLRAFTDPPGPSLPDLVLTYGNVLVVGAALLTKFQPARALPLLAAVLMLAAAAKLLTLDNTLHQTELLAWALAWASTLLIPKARPALLAAVAFAVMLAAITLTNLHPFTFSASPGPFSLLPFSGYLQGDMLGNLRELAQSAWITVAILWLGARLGGHVPGVAIFLVGWILLLEVAQMWIAGRSADITPALTTLVISLLTQALLRRQTNPTPAPVPRAQPGDPGGAAQQGGQSRFAVILPGALMWILAVSAIAWLIRLPGVPYNIRELFVAGGHPLAIAVFTLAVLWLGAGSWFALWLSSKTRHPWLSLPATLMLTGAISLFLLTLSVTQESIMDIAGSTNLHWMVVNKQIWGEWWANVFSAAVAPTFVAPLERLVRYLALYIPPTAFLAIALLALKSGESGQRSADTAKATLALLPILWLCKAISFDWSSTDNLNELIAPTAAFGLGGGAFLYVLMAIIAANIALLGQASSWRGAFIGLLITALCLPASWILLSHGLAAAVEKYGLFYSGTQFLLGPDRSTQLTETALQMRWAIVYLALVATGAAGVQIGRAITRQRR